MKLIKSASGKSTVKMSKREWQSIGKKAGWTKIASAPREQVMKAMKMLLGEGAFMSTTEDCGSSPGGIWFSNEENGIEGLPLYDANGETQGLASEYPYEVRPKLQQIMDQYGWFVEPYDPGTLMAYEI